MKIKSLLALIALSTSSCAFSQEITDAELRKLFITTDPGGLTYERMYGGVVLFKQFFIVSGDACYLKKQAPSLTIFTDQEGGEVIRVDKDPPPSAKEAQKMPIEQFRERVSLSAKALKNACVDANLAPVVELGKYNNRSYGQSIEKVTEIATVFHQEMVRNGIKTVNKHFPGQTEDCDAVKDLTSIGIKIKENSEALTCKIKNNSEFEKKAEVFVKVPSDAIMISSIIYPQYSPYPSFLNPQMNNWIKNKLNYKGLMISDALWEIEATPQTILKVLKTVDWVMVGYSKSVEDAIPFIRKAIKEGYFTESELKQKLTKIEEFKENKPKDFK